MDKMILQLRHVLSELIYILRCGNWNDSIHAGHLLLRQVHNGYSTQGVQRLKRLYKDVSTETLGILI